MARIEEHTSKKRKRKIISNQEQSKPSIDRLSALPDPILCHILSFLPTKLSIATSVLAQRWRFLWTDVSNLQLCSSDYEVESEDGPFFSDIIIRILALHNARSVDTFHISYACDHYALTDYQVETWIATAVARNVRNFHLCLKEYQEARSLPKRLFTCKTLVDLSLEFCDICLSLSTDICFPCLKTIYLSYVGYGDDETLPNLVSCCPVLETLTIDGILIWDNLSHSISSPTIKRLTVFFETEVSSHDKYSLDINAPGLRYLKIKDSLSGLISAQNLTSLIEADISLDQSPFDDELEVIEIEDDDYSGSVLKFLESLCNVESLKLSIDNKKFVGSALSVPTVRFLNLTKLGLAVDWRFISKFLENAHNLEVLIIGKVDKDLKCWMEPREVPKCLLLHLKTITIDHFERSDEDFEMVRYVLMNAQVLKSIRIYCCGDNCDYKEKFLALQRISFFERASVACKLEFH